MAHPVHRLVGLSWWFPKWATSYILLLEHFFSFVFWFLQVFWKMKYYLKIVLSTWCKQSSLRCGDLSKTNLIPAYQTCIPTYSHHPCPVMPAARSGIDSRSFGLIMSLFFLETSFPFSWLVFLLDQNSDYSSYCFII